MRKCIITVVGKDQVGIIAKVCNYLAEANINVLDISQTIVDGYFNMMTVVDVSAADRDFSVYAEDLASWERGWDLSSAARDRKYLKRCTDCKERTPDYDQHIRSKRDKSDDRRGKSGCPHHYTGHQLLDCVDTDLDRLNEKIYRKITTLAENLVSTGEEIEKEFGIPIVNKRISVIPLPLWARPPAKVRRIL